MCKAIYTFLRIMVLPAVLFTACKKDPLTTYNVPDNIYFNYILGANAATGNRGTLTDSMNFTFSYSNATVKDTLLALPVWITGAPAGTDRVYRATVAAGSTAVEAKHYRLPSLVIRAGRVTDTLFIRLLRADDLKQREVSLILQLQPNENFVTNIPYLFSIAGDSVNALVMKIKFSDVLSAGSGWSNYAGFFGDFSEKKVLLMNQVIGFPLNFWSSESDMGTDQLATAVYYATTMSRYLKQQAAAGNTIYEADGVTPMRMGADYQ